MQTNFNYRKNFKTRIQFLQHFVGINFYALLSWKELKSNMANNISAIFILLPIVELCTGHATTGLQYSAQLAGCFYRRKKSPRRAVDMYVCKAPLHHDHVNFFFYGWFEVVCLSQWIELLCMLDGGPVTIFVKCQVWQLLRFEIIHWILILGTISC